MRANSARRADHHAALGWRAFFLASSRAAACASSARSPASFSAVRAATVASRRAENFRAARAISCRSDFAGAAPASSANRNTARARLNACRTPCTPSSVCFTNARAASSQHSRTAANSPPPKSSRRLRCGRESCDEFLRAMHHGPPGANARQTRTAIKAEKEAEKAFPDTREEVAKTIENFVEVSAKTSNEIPREMRTAGHDMGDGFAIVFVPGTVGLEECLKPLDPIGHRIHRL